LKYKQQYSNNRKKSMLFETKTYRNSLSNERFQSFVIQHETADLWIGIDHASFKEEMADIALARLKLVLDELEAYAASNPIFKKSLKPCSVQDDAPTMIRQLAAAGEKAGVGPMAALGGLLSERVGQALLENFSIGELVVENGAKLFVKLQNPLVLSIFAGESPLSGMAGLEILPEQTPLGVGTFTQADRSPMNFGKADAVMIACKETALADALTTSFGNRIKKSADVEKVLNRTESFPEILAAILVCGDQIGVRGEFELKLEAPSRPSPKGKGKNSSGLGQKIRY
jgi:hypothetical protein